jgi:hypothetical protein
MSSATSPQLIVLYVIVGAAIVVAAGAGMHRLYAAPLSESSHEASVEQQNYMREVRERNFRELESGFGRGYGGYGRYQHSGPSRMPSSDAVTQ